MITVSSRIEGRKPSRLMLPPQLKIVGILETVHCVRNALCITQDLALSSVRLATRERALQLSVLKGKQQCPRKSILAERQERSLRPERSHGGIHQHSQMMDQIIKYGSMQGTSDHKRKFDDRRNSNNNNDHPNNRSNDYQNNRNNNSNRNNDYRQ
nr:hypothetical protein [Tanacetum cinerariifolium]